jgi:photosystem II stability/assembly factor-like uncharacterized protein
MRWLTIAALLVVTPAASAAGPWLHVGPPAFPAITAVAAQGNSLFALARDGDVWRADAGSGWVRRSRRPKAGTSILVASPGALYVSSTDPNILSRSNNGARTFRRCGREGLPAGAAFVVATANMRVGVVRSRRLALSSNGCRTWTRPRITGRIRSLARTGTTWLVIVERPNLARAERFRLLASTDLGRTWRVRANRTALTIASPPGLTVSSLVADRVTADRLWLIHEGRLARSDDGGRTWKNASPPALRVTAVVPSATRANNVHVLGLTASRRPITRTSSNAGATWTDIPPPPTAALPVVTSLLATSNSRAALATSSGVWTYAF